MVDCSPEVPDPLSYLDFKPTDSKWDKYRHRGETPSPVRGNESRNLREIVSEVSLLSDDREEALDRIDFYAEEGCISEQEVNEIRQIALGDFEYNGLSRFPDEFIKALSGSLVGRTLKWIVQNADRPQIVMR